MSGYGFVHYEAEEAAKHAIKRPDLKSIVAGRASIAVRPFAMQG